MNIFLLKKLFLTAVTIVLFVMSFSFAQGIKFIHVTTSSNILGDHTTIDNPLLNNNRDAIFFVTPNWNPTPSTLGVYDSSAIGVFYTGSKWDIFNENRTPMPKGAAFNVFIPTSSGNDSFIKSALSSNTQGDNSYINNLSLNNKQDAIFFTTQLWNRGGGTTGIYNNAPTGVYYTGTNWAVFNEDKSNMPMNASFNVYIADAGVTGVDTRNGNESVKDFSLYQNYPNPFNPTTTIQYQLPKASNISIKIYNMLGEVVDELVNKNQNAGYHSVQWKPNLPSGVYIYSLTAKVTSGGSEAKSFVETKKLILLK